MADLEPMTLLFWGLVTFMTPLVLIFVPYLRGYVSQSVMHLMLGLSAGLLGGVTVIELLPEAFHSAGEDRTLTLVVSAGIATGLFILFVVERHLIGVHRRKAHGHEEDDINGRPIGTMAISALAIHGVMDGFVIPIGFAAGEEIGLVVTLAIVLHQIPDSFSAASIGLATGYTRKKNLMFILFTALDTPLGILAGVAFLGIAGIGATTWVVPYGLGLASGTFIFLTAADLIPELQHKTSSVWVTVSIVLGFASVAALELFLGSH